MSTYTIDHSRIDKEVDEVKEQYERAQKNKKLFVEMANYYIKKAEPILKKRGIKIDRSQIFFNPTMDKDKYNRALAYVYFDKKYVENYKDIKVQRLEKELKEAGIPMPIHTPVSSITITLYDDIIEKYLKETGKTMAFGGILNKKVTFKQMFS